MDCGPDKVRVNFKVFRHECVDLRRSPLFALLVELLLKLLEPLRLLSARSQLSEESLSLYTPE